MNFLNPAVLIGLVTAAIPLILHLLNLRKLKTVEFSSLQFLKEMQKNKIRKLKLKQIILLILRTLLIIVIVLAFARPTINNTIPGFETFAKTSSIFIVDNSFSLDLSDEYGNRFNQTKKILNTILSTMQNGDEAIIIEMANSSSGKQYAFSRNTDYLQMEASNMKIAYVPSDLNRSLKQARKLLDEAMNFSKEIYIITDAQPNIFTQSEINKIEAKHTNVYFIPVGFSSKADIKNYSIDSLNIVTRIIQASKPVEIEAKIKNNSSSEIKGLITDLVFNKERVAQRSMDLPSHSAKNISIAAAISTTGVVSAAVILENDAFDADNHKYFGFITPEKPDVAIFGGKATRDFINMAVHAAGSDEFAKIINYNTNEISSVNLSQYDLVILSSGKYATADFVRLRQYISNGGNALVFATDETDFKILATGLSSLGFGNSETKEYSQERPMQFTTTDKIHPLFEGVFKIDAESRRVVESPKIYKAITVLGGQSLIEVGTGYFLSESIIDDGKALYCAVPPNLEWSNFPMTGMFPAVVIRSIAYLASRPAVSYNFELGKSSQIIIPKKYCTGNNFKIVDPNANEFLRQTAMLSSGAVLMLDDMTLPGVYTIYNSNNVIVALVAFNLQGSESDFTKLTKEAIIDSLNIRIAEATNLDFFDNTDDIVEGVKRIHTGTELWKFFLVLALLFAAAEMLVQKNFKKEN